MRTLIVDDELNSRKLLRNMLEGYCPGVEVVGMADRVSTAVDQIRESRPDLVFLDIELPGGDGLAVLEAFAEPEFKVVFVSGYDAMDLQHLDLAALAWIQKPVELGVLQSVVEQCRAMLPASAAQVEFVRELQNAQEERGLILSSGGKHERIHFAEVAYIEAQRAYATFHLLNGEERLAAYALSHYEKILPAGTFFRIHRSYLVNTQVVREVDSGRGGFTELATGTKLPIATRRKGEFLRFLKSAQGGK